MKPDKRCDCSLYLTYDTKMYVGGAGRGVMMQKRKLKIELKARPEVLNDGLDGSFHASCFAPYIQPAIFSTAMPDAVRVYIVPCPYIVEPIRMSCPMALCAFCMTMSLGKDVIIAQMYTHVSQLINMTVM